MLRVGAGGWKAGKNFLKPRNTREMRFAFFYHFFCTVVQTDGNGSDDYMHSGIRGGPHAGAFRWCSFTKAEIKLQVCFPSVSRKPSAVWQPTGLYGAPVSVRPATAARVPATTYSKVGCIGIGCHVVCMWIGTASIAAKGWGASPSNWPESRRRRSLAGRWSNWVWN